MNRLSLYFTKPKHVEIREEATPSLKSGQVMVQTLFSAISPGTELLFYNQQVPTGQSLDTDIPSLFSPVQFPLKYGYSIVGKIVAVGPGVAAMLLGREVFSFHPHESLFTANLNELLEIPQSVSAIDAVFLPNMETAVNFLMDGRPVIGEKVAVFGQGIVGLLTTALLSRFPLNDLITIDPFPTRRHISEQLGAKVSLDPGDSWKEIKFRLKDDFSTGADLVVEVSGNADALTQAVELTSFDGRILIGSWYGSKPVNVRLDTSFHRNRIRLISSQVSTIAPYFLGRWSKLRRFETVWRMLETIKPSRLISRFIPITQADEAYRLLDENREDVVQIIFTYPHN